ncbi:cytochrome c maturation protein CcmE [Bacteroidia bacterium]|nr:cytochrome c maturation protein CcmE [Bacteroidia bacterium]
MKPTAIALIVVLAVAIAGIMSTYSSAEQSATFTEATENPGDTYHITGFLMKEMPMEYDALKDANYFSFYLKDKNGDLCKVVSSEPKQQDFERAETVNMYGHVDGEIFRATKVIPKCPSKYKDEQNNKNAQAYQQ